MVVKGLAPDSSELKPLPVATNFGNPDTFTQNLCFLVCKIKNDFCEHFINQVTERLQPSDSEAASHPEEILSCSLVKLPQTMLW